MFLMRVLFTMFAEDVDLLPKSSFQDLLKDCLDTPEIFPAMMEELWTAMDKGTFAAGIKHKVKRFNGHFFENRRALKLAREEIGELVAAAAHDWKDVEPAIFGTFLEQALDPGERRKLGAHYTPRAYVERLVIATVIDPLQDEWNESLATIERLRAENRDTDAIAIAQGFHDKLCETLVLDPACGTGNFLYVALELMKKLEGKVLETIADLGGQEALALDRHTVDPHQFLGLEVNPRAAAIAELVLWIGHLQWHFRNRGVAPTEPILRKFDNIRHMDAVLAWDGQPLPKIVDGKEVLPNPRRPDWPRADYIVGNPPFVGGKDIRARMGTPYAQALWAAHKHMNESADFVMYWWDRAGEILLKPKTRLKRFGFVTTNSISQVFQRRAMLRHLSAKKPLSLVMAIPDHPWTKATRDSAAVRIAMTVAQAGSHEGRLREVVHEAGLDTDSPAILFRDSRGIIHSDLTVGVDVSSVIHLKANEGLSSRGMALHGSGFIVTPQEAAHLGLGRRSGLDTHIRAYRNGRDLTSRPRGAMVIDLFGLSADDVRTRFPEVYQHLQTTVKVARDKHVADATNPTKDALSYARNWWVFGKPRSELRPALASLPRYIATVETAKHRVFQFLDAEILPDNRLVCFGLEQGYSLGVLSSKTHVAWVLATGGTLEDRPIYTKSNCFDPFPFPDATLEQRAEVGAIAEELDAHRKKVLDAHPHLTLTGLYNVLERLNAGASPDDLTDKERTIHDDGLVQILKELHDRLDVAVASAYGWPADLGEEEILARLVALNKERSKEEARGHVRWLRPDYQIPRFGSDKEKAEQLEADFGEAVVPLAKGPKPGFPRAERDQTPAVLNRLIEADGPLDAAAIAASFKQGRRCLPAVTAVLAALHRLGLVSSDDGKRFSFRQAA
ncbi:class I SAM-dependent DNA methyltransferase [Stappia sp. ES.058]|uniref:class I SAM-dependent DNA methyltransferase n=1 Tax=Stappia sp. ES.058 TaxID=1881061 RepID=UPI00352BA71B